MLHPSPFGHDKYNFYMLRGTLNGESLEFEDTSYYSGADYTQQEALDAQILYVKEGVVEDGENEGNNDWINAENTVPIE